MQLILTKTIENIGTRGDLVTVKDGYARNFLLPQGLALLASEAAEKKAEAWRLEEKEREQREMQDYEALVEVLEKQPITFPQKTKNKKGDLYGSVGPKELSEILKENGMKIEKDWIDLKDPIRKTGRFVVPIKFPHSVNGKISVSVTAEE